MECSTFASSQVLGTVRHGGGHEDAAGVLTSAGTPLWFIRGCIPQHTSFGGREDAKTTRSKTPQEENKNARAEQCSAKGHGAVHFSPVLGTV
jgi:hypothetical protein